MRQVIVDIAEKEWARARLLIPESALHICEEELKETSRLLTLATIRECADVDPTLKSVVEYMFQAADVNQDGQLQTFEWYNWLGGAPIGDSQARDKFLGEVYEANMGDGMGGPGVWDDEAPSSSSSSMSSQRAVLASTDMFVLALRKIVHALKVTFSCAIDNLTIVSRDGTTDPSTLAAAFVSGGILADLLNPDLILAILKRLPADRMELVAKAVSMEYATISGLSPELREFSAEVRRRKREEMRSSVEYLKERKRRLDNVLAELERAVEYEYDPNEGRRHFSDDDDDDDDDDDPLENIAFNARAEDGRLRSRILSRDQKKHVKDRKPSRSRYGIKYVDGEVNSARNDAQDSAYGHTYMSSDAEPLSPARPAPPQRAVSMAQLRVVPELADAVRALDAAGMIENDDDDDDDDRISQMTEYETGEWSYQRVGEDLNSRTHKQSQTIGKRAIPRDKIVDVDEVAENRYARTVPYSQDGRTVGKADEGNMVDDTKANDVDNDDSDGGMDAYQVYRRSKQIEPSGSDRLRAFLRPSKEATAQENERSMTSSTSTGTSTATSTSGAFAGFRFEKALQRNLSEEVYIAVDIPVLTAPSIDESSSSVAINTYAQPSSSTASSLTSPTPASRNYDTNNIDDIDDDDDDDDGNDDMSGWDWDEPVTGDWDDPPNEDMMSPLNPLGVLQSVQNFEYDSVAFEGADLPVHRIDYEDYIPVKDEIELIYSTAEITRSSSDDSVLAGETGENDDVNGDMVMGAGDPSDIDGMMTATTGDKSSQAPPDASDESANDIYGPTSRLFMLPAGMLRSERDASGFAGVASNPIEHAEYASDSDSDSDSHWGLSPQYTGMRAGDEPTNALGLAQSQREDHDLLFAQSAQIIRDIQIERASHDNLDDRNALRLRQVMTDKASTGQVQQDAILQLACALRTTRLQHASRLTAAERQRLAVNTMQIFGPLSHQIGQASKFPELEVLSYKFLLPQSFEYSFKPWYDHFRVVGKKILKKFKTNLKQNLENDLLMPCLARKVTLQSRFKAAPSAYKKMLHSSKQRGDLHDMLGLRIIVDEHSYDKMSALLRGRRGRVHLASILHQKLHRKDYDDDDDNHNDNNDDDDDDDDERDPNDPTAYLDICDDDDGHHGREIPFAEQAESSSAAMIDALLDSTDEIPVKHTLNILRGFVYAVSEEGADAGRYGDVYSAMRDGFDADSRALDVDIDMNVIDVYETIDDHDDDLQDAFMRSQKDIDGDGISDRFEDDEVILLTNDDPPQRRDNVDIDCEDEDAYRTQPGMPGISSDPEPSMKDKDNGGPGMPIDTSTPPAERSDMRAEDSGGYVSTRYGADAEQSSRSSQPSQFDMWVENAGKFKDYVSCPKPSGYQSIHMVLVNKATGINLEVQIRSERMHFCAEHGSASHKAYKALMLPSTTSVSASVPERAKDSEQSLESSSSRSHIDVNAEVKTESDINENTYNENNHDDDDDDDLAELSDMSSAFVTAETVDPDADDADE
jgi:ppGpp synthetase/RelA/SpoT-type nucleotidyltranferase